MRFLKSPVNAYSNAWKGSRTSQVWWVRSKRLLEIPPCSASVCFTPRKGLKLCPRGGPRGLGHSFGLTRVIQQLIAKTAASRRVEGDVEKMKNALSDYKQASTATDSRRADHLLHEAIAAATQNAYLVRLNRDLATSANLGFTAHPYSAELKARALDQYVHLIEAIEEGEGKKRRT